MTLVPQEQTPLSEVPSPATWNEVLTIAVMRLLMPDRLVPASLDVAGIEGLRSRLDAGAIVVTSLVPPQRGLCGVANADYEVDDGLRSAAEVRPRLAELACGREPTRSSRRGLGSRARGGGTNTPRCRGGCRHRDERQEGASIVG